MFHLGDKPPKARLCVLCAVVLATLLGGCAPRTEVASGNAANVGEPALDADMPVVVITAQRGKPLRLAVKADSKGAASKAR